MTHDTTTHSEHSADQPALNQALEELEQLLAGGRDRTLEIARLVSIVHDNVDDAKAWEELMRERFEIDRRMAYRYSKCGTVMRDESKRSVVVHYNTLADLMKLEAVADLPAELLGLFLQGVDIQHLKQSEVRREVVLWWAKQKSAPTSIRRKALAIRRKQNADPPGSVAAQLVRKLGKLTETRLQRGALELELGEVVAGLDALGTILDAQIDRIPPEFLIALGRQFAEIGAERIEQGEARMRQTNENPIQPGAVECSDHSPALEAGAATTVAAGSTK